MRRNRYRCESLNCSGKLAGSYLRLVRLPECNPDMRGPNRLRKNFLGRRTSLFFAVLLGLSLIGPVWADDGDEKKKVETSNEVDCEDKDNAALPECRPVNPPVVTQESAPQRSLSQLHRRLRPVRRALAFTRAQLRISSSNLRMLVRKQLSTDLKTVLTIRAPGHAVDMSAETIPAQRTRWDRELSITPST